MTFPYNDEESMQLVEQYEKDPSSLTCPKCGKVSLPHRAGRSTMQVVGFIEGEIDEQGWAQLCEPVGAEYAVLVGCRLCGSGVALYNPWRE